MQEYILNFENVASKDFCKDLCDFFNKYEKYAEGTEYGFGENTSSRKIVLVENMIHKDKFFVESCNGKLREVVEVLTAFVHSNIVPVVYPISMPIFSPIEVRKMLGPTQNHSDNISPFLVKKVAKSLVAYRVVTIIMTISSSSEILFFPKQEISIKLKQGSVVIFPPYWMFEHQTLGEKRHRISITTWLNESVEIKPGDSVPLILT